MTFRWHERHLKEAELENVSVGIPDATGFSARSRKTNPIPPTSAKTIGSDPLPPFSDLVETDCQDCGGKGFDPGALNAVEAEECTWCHGSGRESILRNYLAEAFRIAAKPDTNLEIERAHLVALIAYARQTVSALLNLPEVA
jgi:hypothetical protein